MAMTHQGCVAKKGFTGLMGVLMMQCIVSAESIFLSLK